MSIRCQSKTGELWWREGKLHQVRVCVNEGHFTVHKANEIAVKMIDEMSVVNEWTEEVTKKDGTIGIDLKGGVTKNEPVRISKIKGGDLERSGQAQKDDILLSVNEEPMLNKSLTAVKQFISGAQGVIKLHLLRVKDKEGKQNTEGDSNDDDQRSNRSNDDSGVYFTSVEERKALKQLIGEGLWIQIHESSLGLSLLTSYQRGNDIPMPNTMSMSFIDAKKPLLLHCSAEEPNGLTEWTEVLSNNILAKNEEEVQSLLQNKDTNFDIEDLIAMGWVFESIQSSRAFKVWVKKFLVLRQADIQIYDKLPETAEEWQRCERSYKLVDSFIRPLEDDELPNLRSCSILIQTPAEAHVISFEYPSSYHYWLQSIHRTRCLAVIKLKTARFKGSWNKRYVNFIIDFMQGIMVEDHTTKAVYWQKSFSEIKESSDKNNSVLQLQFKNDEKESIMLRDIACCVHSLEAFMSAKVYEKETEHKNI